MTQIFDSSYFLFESSPNTPYRESFQQCAPGSNVKVSLGTSRQAERSFVASTTSGIYIEKIILFMLWLFDARTESLLQDYIPEFEVMNHEYLLEFQYREEDENVTNRRNRNQINEIPGIQYMMRQIVDEIQT